VQWEHQYIVPLGIWGAVTGKYAQTHDTFEASTVCDFCIRRTRHAKGVVEYEAAHPQVIGALMDIANGLTGDIVGDKVSIMGTMGSGLTASSKNLAATLTGHYHSVTLSLYELLPGLESGMCPVDVNMEYATQDLMKFARQSGANGRTPLVYGGLGNNVRPGVAGTSLRDTTKPGFRRRRLGKADNTGNGFHGSGGGNKDPTALLASDYFSNFDGYMGDAMTGAYHRQMVNIFGMCDYYGACVYVQEEVFCDPALNRCQSQCATDGYCFSKVVLRIALWKNALHSRLQHSKVVPE
jgi:hypothetical protein